MPTPRDTAVSDAITTPAAVSFVSVIIQEKIKRKIFGEVRMVRMDMHAMHLNTEFIHNIWYPIHAHP
jgi:hypothetical protein